MGKRALILPLAHKEHINVTPRLASVIKRASLYFSILSRTNAHHHCHFDTLGRDTTSPFLSLPPRLLSSLFLVRRNPIPHVVFFLSFFLLAFSLVIHLSLRRTRPLAILFFPSSYLLRLLAVTHGPPFFPCMPSISSYWGTVAAAEPRRHRHCVDAHPTSSSSCPCRRWRPFLPPPPLYARASGVTSVTEPAPRRVGCSHDVLTATAGRPPPLLLLFPPRCCPPFGHSALFARAEGGIPLLSPHHRRLTTSCEDPMVLPSSK